MKQQEQITKDTTAINLVMDKGKKAMNNAVPSKDAWNHGGRKNARARKGLKRI